MVDIIFVRTRYWYDSYTDFWKLVELSGFPTCYVDEVDVTRHVTYITTPINGEWRPHLDNHMSEPRNAHLVLWNLERPSGNGGVGNYAQHNRQLLYDRYFDEVWVSDRRLAQETGARFVILGSDCGLGEPGDPAKMRFDFVHMSYIVPRRAAVYDRFDQNRVAPNCWPPHRHEILQLSKFALNIHQDDHPFQEPLRMALFAAYGIPVLTETINDSYPWSREFCEYNPYDGIVEKLHQMLRNDYGRWRDMGLRARARMCGEFRFRDVVMQNW